MFKMNYNYRNIFITNRTVKLIFFGLLIIIEGNVMISNIKLTQSLDVFLFIFLLVGDKILAQCQSKINNC